MPISITCENCSKKLRVKDEIAGKKVKCPQCKGVIAVPGAAATVSAAENNKQWYVRTDDDEDYGPIPRSELNGWVSEGRLNADCQVLAEGSDQWQWASDLYPQLEEPESVSGEIPTPAPAPQPAAAPKQETPKQETPRQATPQPVAAPKQQPTPAIAKPAQPAAAQPAAAQPAKPSQPAASGGPVIGLPGGATGGKPADSSKFDFGVDNSATSRARGKRVVRKKRNAGGSSVSGSNPMVQAGAAKSAPAAAAGASGEVGDKSKILAGLLGVFAGSIGVHNFYLGNTGRGVLQLVLFFVTCGAASIWGIIEGVMILTGSIKTDGQGKLLKE